MLKLQRRLQARHIMMIAIGGSIGTGIFLASGAAIHIAGPGGAFLAYLLMSFIVYCLMNSLGEMAAYRPTTGTFCEYSSRYVSSAFGFAMGWNYWFNWAITIAAEVVAAALIMQFWFPHTPIIWWSLLFFFLILILNMVAVNLYGEVEYWLSFLKVSFIVIFIVVGILIMIGLLGHAPEAIGFKNWSIGDAPFHGGFLGFISVFLIVGFAFQGTELVGVTAGEAKEPKKNIPKAVKQTFFRLMLFNILAVGVIGSLISYQNPSLVGGDSVATSPFTLIFQDAGFQYAATIINAVILIAIISAGNASMYSATRILWHLAHTKQAPFCLSKLTPNGIPMRALFFTALMGGAFFATSFFSGGEVFSWLINISSLAGFITWFGIALSHYRFRRACEVQNRVKELSFVAKWFPIAPIVSMIVMLIIIVGQEFNDFYNNELTLTKFFATYIGVILFIGIFLINKWMKKSKLIPFKQCDLD